MSDEVDATAAGGSYPIPEWLKTWEADSGTSTVHVYKKLEKNKEPGAYEKVELHNFKLFGKTFLTNQYVGRVDGKVVSQHQGAGVTAEFKKKLVAAQRLAYQEYARQSEAKKSEATEAGFASWCSIKGQILGWQFRGGNHRYGNAIDIDSLWNPYIVTHTGKDYGGELPSPTPSAADATVLVSLRKAAITGYVHALEFVYGADIKSAIATYDEDSFFGITKPGEKPEDAYHRFANTSEALAFYMSTGMTPRKGNRIEKTMSELARDPDDMRARLKTHIDMKLGKTNPSLNALLTDEPKLLKLRDQIYDDHEAVRKMILFGSWTVKDGAVTGYDATRDPCYGFLSIREEIAVALKKSGMRWGAVDFGAQQSGDVMHFDITDPPALTSDPNTGEVRYEKQ